MVPPAHITPFYNEHRAIGNLRYSVGAYIALASIITAVALVVIALFTIYAIRTASPLSIKAVLPAFIALPCTIPLWTKGMSIQNRLTKQRSDLTSAMKSALIEKKDLTEKKLVKFIEDELIKNIGHRTYQSLWINDLKRACTKADFSEQELAKIQKALGKAETNLTKDLEKLGEEN